MKELADAKAENDALRDDVAAGRRRLHIKAICQSVREATTASAWIISLPDWWGHRFEQDYFTLRERLITITKTTEGTRYINGQLQIELPIDGQLIWILWAIHALPAEYRSDT